MYYSFAIPRHIYNKIINRRIVKEFDEGNEELFDIFILHFKEINKLIKQRFGNETKFVILTFEGTKKELWMNQLNKEGIDVVDISELIGVDDLSNPQHGYFEPDIAAHPNGKVWNEFIPKLKKIYPDL